MSLPPHVLHVDDDDDIREIVALVLEEMGGIRVTSAAGGQDALDAMALHRPDMVLLDVMMPGMDGPTVLRRIRDDPALAELPVVFLTAKSLRQDRARLQALGVTDIIEKPFRATELIERLRGIWAGR